MRWMLLGCLIGVVSCGDDMATIGDAGVDADADAAAIPSLDAPAADRPADGVATDAAAAEVAPLPACAWPASLVDENAGRGACHAARALLSCVGSNQTFEDCLSNDPAACPGPASMPGVTFTCHDVCAPHEYGVACGSIGPGPISDPPAGCHDPLATPAGIVFYCCPCQP